ncbi:MULTISPECIES: hypothetical protein [unclassified Nocardioides]|nr:MULTISPECIES: hypothetical protein [unclassified Nocardioides]
MSRRPSPVEQRRRKNVLQYTLLTLLSALTLVLVYLALTRTP